MKKVNLSRLELLPKNKPINIRMNESLLALIKKKAKVEGVSYQKWIRCLLEQGLRRSS